MNVRTEILEEPTATGARIAPGLLNNGAAMQGLEELIGKIEPLLAGRRLNRVIDLLSVVADVVDMSDAYMVEKVGRAFEDVVGAAWSAGNAARVASAKLERMPETPSLIGLLRMTREPEIRRGMAFVLAVAGAFGRQNAYDPIDYMAD
ncbi:DUF1641 domain-containing protein [Ralstonia solanacearum]|uniref:DUF1641 domain-containing protein n=3 Tax=Ralstonia solanacearum TaxID=305 RepID=A0A5H2PUE9_RALSL|nr:DUF1641 domain-containing protein [Ralstonia solanacearum]AEG72256.1 conserved hypothetical protein [Ralstonia solanacearum Po82]AMP71201.1 hypothetical protein UW163_16775 [Ralstonia solanacearum]AMP75742.1 hypothetical protein RALBFv3_16045 [Ralstonia solanacearum]AYB63460.1 DUF1641 domain-containing protein [Ralstonia solanacearum]MBB6588258.1 DUF1641 domain-containing protein [Ralstonia solanacearum]